MIHHAYKGIIIGVCIFSVVLLPVLEVHATLVVNTNMASLNALKNLKATQASLEQVFQRISEGFRISKESDDATGLGVAEQLDEQMRSFRVAERNTANAITLQSSAESGLGQVSGIVVRMRELAVQGSNGDLSSPERSKISKEALGLARLLEVIPQQKEFNGKDTFKDEVLVGKKILKKRLTQVATDIVKPTKDFFNALTTIKIIAKKPPIKVINPNGLTQLIAKLDKASAAIISTQDDLNDLTDSIIEKAQKNLDDAEEVLREYDEWIGEADQSGDSADNVDDMDTR